MRASDFRRIAIGMKGAVEGAHMGHPDFRVNGRIFATLHDDGQSGMVKLTPDQQEQIVRDHSGGFAPERGAWGRAGCTRVRLAAVEEDTLGEALTLAWQNAAKQAASQPSPKHRSPGAARRSTRK
jgi:hypothetical protein